MLSLPTVLQSAAAVALFIGAAVYIYGTYKKERTKVDDELEEGTINRLNNAINSLKLENEYLKKENEALKAQLTLMEAKITKSENDIVALRDLATNQSAINEVKGLLQKFEFIIPMMKSFQEADAQLLKGMAEIRGMIREDRKTTQRVERRIMEKSVDDTAKEA
jgi:cell division protein FtsB